MPILSTVAGTASEGSGDALRNGLERGKLAAAPAEEPRENSQQQQQRNRASDDHSPLVASRREDTGSIDGDQNTANSEEDGIDPVMLKYMKLVQEKRQERNVQPSQAQSTEKSGLHDKEFDVPPLSQDISSLDGFSNHEDDAFADW